MIFDDEYYMRQALREAQKAFDLDEIPIGAIVVMNNTIISRGHNLTEQLQDVTAHAEMMALTAAFNALGSKYLPNATLFVTIEPCLMCSGALYWSKIGKVVYGARDIKNGYTKHFTCNEQLIHPSPFHPKTTVIHGVLENECATLMLDFFKNKR